MNYRAMKDFFGPGNSILFARGAILTEADLERHPWLRRSLRSGTIVEVPEEAPKTDAPTGWDALLEEDPL